jgi:N-acetylglucosaminyldiphosphoundecaprenol N-acetyl-beta-D-mannosaminyltransferase
LGIAVDPLTITQAMDLCVWAVEHEGYLPIGVVNAAKVVAMRRNDRLLRALEDCGVVLADGQSVVWASRLLRSPLPERVTGIDLFTRLLAEASRRAYSVYFLGARADVLACLLSRVDLAYPGLVVAGAHDGYFGTDEDRQVAARIRESRADLLFVGMTSPRKELFVSRWGPLTGAKVVHGVGGSFDVLAGITRRAPLWWQDHGLEWLFRVAQEPVRLGRRYATTNMSFMALVARELLRQRLMLRDTHGPGAARPSGDRWPAEAAKERS